ncbi:MAG: hypothetical protein M3163_03045 [Actinomycetota bacterium]|nr:hypothetical protein [Actinomycetota bacterium]
MDRRLPGGRLDPNVVLGLFSWSDDPAYNYREIDIEVARWGDVAGDTNAQYVVQPWDRGRQPAPLRTARRRPDDPRVHLEAEERVVPQRHPGGRDDLAVDLRGAGHPPCRRRAHPNEPVARPRRGSH